MPEALEALRKVAAEVDCVFSVDICTRVDESDGLPTEKMVKKSGYWISPNGKTNIGMGRPLKEGM